MGLWWTKPKYNISHELFVVRDQASRGVLIYLGDNKYFQATQFEQPYIYVPCGGLFYSTVNGDWQQENPVVRGFTKAVGDMVQQSAEFIGDDTYQPEFNPELYSIIAGTLVTFDWETDTVLGPILSKNDLEDDIWEK